MWIISRNGAGVKGRDMKLVAATTAIGLASIAMILPAVATEPSSNTQGRIELAQAQLGPTGEYNGRSEVANGTFKASKRAKKPAKGTASRAVTRR